MPTKKTTKKKEEKAFEKKMENKCKKSKADCGGGCAYFLGFIGAAVYYISTATSFWVGVLGFLKALVWPAFLVYELLKSVGA